MMTQSSLSLHLCQPVSLKSCESSVQEEAPILHISMQWVAGSLHTSQLP